MWNIFQLKSEVISGTRMGENQTSNRPREKKEGGKGDVCRDVRNELKINN